MSEKVTQKKQGKSRSKFAAQTHPDWQIYASDDGSTDTSLQLLKERQQKLSNNQLEILSLTCNTSIEADYYAYPLNTD